MWRAGTQTVRRVEAVEPSAILEIHVGPRKTRYYQEVGWLPVAERQLWPLDGVCQKVAIIML